MSVGVEPKLILITPLKVKKNSHQNEFFPIKLNTNSNEYPRI